MDCEKVRDRFSSLLEKELTPTEEKILRDHLSSCSECRRELEGFKKAMQWLHSMDDVEVPEGFLPELYKKMGERKKAIPINQTGGRRFRFPHLLKLPAQAVAMVAIVFFVLYMSKIMPVENHRTKDTAPAPSFLSMEKKSEERLAQKETIEDREQLEIPRKDSHPGESEPVDGRASKEEKKQEPQMALHPSPELERVKEGWVAKEKAALASKPLKEMVLRVSDQEKAIHRIHEIVKQFGGEMMGTENQLLVASLPTGSVEEFKKELERLSSIAQVDQSTSTPQEIGRLRGLPHATREEVEGREKGGAGKAADESRTIIRILLVKE